MDLTESDRLAIINDLIDRYLADAIDRRQMTEWVTLSRLQDQWPVESASGLLRVLTAHHLFMFERGDWPEDTLRTSLAQLQERATINDRAVVTTMFDAQWLGLMRAGHVPPGSSYQHTKGPEDMTPEELAAGIERVRRQRRRR